MCQYDRDALVFSCAKILSAVLLKEISSTYLYIGRLCTPVRTLRLASASENLEHQSYKYLKYFMIQLYFCIAILTLKVPRKPVSEKVVCLYRLLNILAYFSNLFFCIQANNVDPDQTAPEGAVWSGSTLFAKMSFKITSR